MRNILNKARPKDKPAMAADLKELFNNFEAGATFNRCIEKVRNLYNKMEAIV